jgi:hypothetical protein
VAELVGGHTRSPAVTVDPGVVGTAVGAVAVALAGVAGEATDAAEDFRVHELQILAIGTGVAGGPYRVEQRRPIVGVQRGVWDLYVAHDRTALAVDRLGDVPDSPVTAGLPGAFEVDRVHGLGELPEGLQELLVTVDAVASRVRL